MPDIFLAMFLACANDNAPNDPRDYEDFDPADALEAWPDDMTISPIFNNI